VIRLQIVRDLGDIYIKRIQPFREYVLIEGPFPTAAAARAAYPMASWNRSDEATVPNNAPQVNVRIHEDASSQRLEARASSVSNAQRKERRKR
jgi:hypothetical protein